MRCIEDAFRCGSCCERWKPDADNRGVWVDIRVGRIFPKRLHIEESLAQRIVFTEDCFDRKPRADALDNLQTSWSTALGDPPEQSKDSSMFPCCCTTAAKIGIKGNLPREPRQPASLSGNGGYGKSKSPCHPHLKEGGLCYSAGQNHISHRQGGKGRESRSTPYVSLWRHHVRRKCGWAKVNFLPKEHTMVSVIDF